MNDSEKIAVSTSHAPAAIGPYSQAVRLGNLLYASGQIPLDPASGQIVPGAITEQTTRVLENIKAILAAAGTDRSGRAAAGEGHGGEAPIGASDVVAALPAAFRALAP